MLTILATDEIDALYYARKHNLGVDYTLITPAHLLRARPVLALTDKIHATPAVYNHPRFEWMVKEIDTPHMKAPARPLPITLARTFKHDVYQWTCDICQETSNQGPRGYSIMTANLHHQWRHQGVRGSLRPLKETTK